MFLTTFVWCNAM
jgi:hypothetical protein